MVSTLAGNVALAIERSGGRIEVGQLPKTADSDSPPFLWIGVPEPLRRAFAGRNLMEIVQAVREHFDPVKPISSAAASTAGLMLTMIKTHQPNAPADEIRQGWREVERLQHASFLASTGTLRTSHAMKLIQTLVDPNRPAGGLKLEAILPILEEIRPELEKRGFKGRFHHLLGCFLLRGANTSEALKEFVKALAEGRASVGIEWFRLIQLGCQTAKELKRSRDVERFARWARIEGLGGDSIAPKAEAILMGLSKGIALSAAASPR